MPRPRPIIVKFPLSPLKVALLTVTAVFATALITSFVTSSLVKREISVNDSDKVLAQQVSTASEMDNTPLRILLPTLNVDLPIEPAPILKDTWQVFENAAGLGQGTNENNLVIFAHARPEMFARLSELQIGDKFYLLGNSKWQTFEVVDKSYIFPEDINTVLKTANAAPTVTLFSCDGPNDEKRVVIKATLSGHSEGGEAN